MTLTMKVTETVTMYVLKECQWGVYGGLGVTIHYDVITL